MLLYGFVVAATVCPLHNINLPLIANKSILNNIYKYVVHVQHTRAGAPTQQRAVMALLLRAYIHHEAFCDHGNYLHLMQLFVERIACDRRLTGTGRSLCQRKLYPVWKPALRVFKNIFYT